MTAPIPVAWRPRSEPLSPVGVAAVGPAARALAARLLARSDAALVRLLGVAGVAGSEERDLLLVFGSGEDGGARAELPWVDGVTYLGRDPDAPLLYLPTTVEPTVHPRLFERALLGLAGSELPPFAVLLAPPLLISSAEARPIVRDRLAGWLARSS